MLDDVINGSKKGGFCWDLLALRLWSHVFLWLFAVGGARLVYPHWVGVSPGGEPKWFGLDICLSGLEKRQGLVSLQMCTDFHFCGLNDLQRLQDGRYCKVSFVVVLESPKIYEPILQGPQLTPKNPGLPHLPTTPFRTALRAGPRGPRAVRRAPKRFGPATRCGEPPEGSRSEFGSGEAERCGADGWLWGMLGVGPKKESFKEKGWLPSCFSCFFL